VYVGQCGINSTTLLQFVGTSQNYSQCSIIHSLLIHILQHTTGPNAVSDKTIH